MDPVQLSRHPMHQFWPDGLSLLNQSGINTSRLLEAGQITDTFLLALWLINACSDHDPSKLKPNQQQMHQPKWSNLVIGVGCMLII